MKEAIAKNDGETLLREYRVRSLMWPYFFIKVVLQYEDLTPDFHGKELERFIGLLERGHRKQAIEFPRAHFKTTCFTIGCGIWFILPVTEEDRKYAIDVLKILPDEWDRRVKLHCQDYSQLLAFESADNGSVKLGEIKRHFEQNDLFRACFPEIAYTGKESPWSTRAIRCRRSQQGFNIGESTFEVMGVDSALQSRHYDIIWEDDIVGKAATEQPSVMASTIRWHGQLTGVMGGPQLKTDTWRFLVSNRWGYSDLNSHIRKSDPHFLFHTRSAIEFNKDKGADTPIFPERFDLKKLEEYRVSAGMSRYDWACQFMNTPFLEGDRRVDIDKIHRYTVESDGKIACSCGYSTYASHMVRYGHYDPYNAKGVRSSSCPAIVVVGLSEDKHVFILQYWTNNGSYNRIFDQIVAYNDLWWPDAWTYEDVGNQNMAEFYLRQLQKQPGFKDEHKYFRRILPVPTRGRAKDIRIADSLLPIIEHGKLSIQNQHQTLLTMLETFPAEMPDHDYDLLDALAQGPSVWRYPQAGEDVKAQRLTQEEMLAKLGQPYGYVSPAVQ